jgi:SpoVK/Ycf46/Vps4 family AAA+-type ATPase
VNAFARWEQLVLPADSIEQLREICLRVDQRDRVFGEWGFGERASRGRGVHALFAGPSGTGKTMAAEVMANHLGLDLHRIDLSAVVSKYIGETEKNLERILDLAVDVILFFDEADALFGKRSEVRDAHDRYANIEISYLLQRMEEYDGLSILATNLRGNIDEAFLRRLTFQVQFPFPDAGLRRGLWRSVWPEPLPRGADVDLDRLADTFTLSGGNIRNVVLGAAFQAAGGGGPVALEHVVRALQRELQKVGRAVTLDDVRAELSARRVAA